MFFKPRDRLRAPLGPPRESCWYAYTPPPTTRQPFARFVKPEPTAVFAGGLIEELDKDDLFLGGGRIPGRGACTGINKPWADRPPTGKCKTEN